MTERLTHTYSSIAFHLFSTKLNSKQLAIIMDFLKMQILPFLNNKSKLKCAKSLQLCPILCDPMYCSPPGSSVHGILQARNLEWGASSSSKRSSHPRDQTCIRYTSCFSGWIFKYQNHLESLRCPNNKSKLECEWYIILSIKLGANNCSIKNQ